MVQVTSVKADFEQWKPEVNTHVADLKHAVNYLGECMEKLFGDSSKHSISNDEPVIEHPDPDPNLYLGKKTADPAHLGSTSFEVSSRKFGHHHETQRRRAGLGWFTPLQIRLRSQVRKIFIPAPQFTVKGEDIKHRDQSVLFTCFHLALCPTLNFPNSMVRILSYGLRELRLTLMSFLLSLANGLR